MSNQKYSGEVNLDHPVTDEQDDGTCLHFHDLPPILRKCPYVIFPDNDTRLTKTTNKPPNTLAQTLHPHYRVSP